MRKKRKSKVSLARKILKNLNNPSAVNPEEYGLSKEEYEGLVEAIKFLRKNFPNKKDSWIIRAITRVFTVKEIGNNRWHLEGIKEFGDVYGFYRVTYYQTSNKYYCTCYTTSYGNTRKRRICTHIAAVMLYRRWKGDLSYYIQRSEE